MKVKSIEELYQIYLAHPLISKDSRKITPNCIYFALKGEHFDGNQFALQALESGAAYAVVDDKRFDKNERTLFVDDCLESLQDLARHHRKKLNIPIIGITGSNGKTTTKELINQVLQTEYQSYATEGNYNNHIGVPLTILSIDQAHEIAVIEMGANHQGEIDFLCSISMPDFGLITNIGKAHLEGFGGVEGIKKGKSELYRYLSNHGGKIFINGDDQVLKELVPKNLEQIRYGESESNDCYGTILKAKPTIELNWSFQENSGKASTQLYGDYNFTNMMAAACIGAYFKVPAKQIKRALESYQSQNNRSQLVELNGCKVFLDAYNANPSSMELALLNFKSNDQQNQGVILGDMFELGEDAPIEHQKIITLVEKLQFNKACFVGEYFFKERDSHSQHAFFRSTSEAKKWFDEQEKTNASFLIKGSRGMALEKIIK